jgi:hypothetical protein
MSAKAATITTETSGLAPTELRILRYAVGATLAMLIALGVGWPLSFLTPVLSLGFLAAPKRLELKAGISFVLVVALACLAGLFLSEFVLPFPFVFLPFIGLCLFRLFYAKANGVSPLVVLWMLIALLVLPLVGMQVKAVAFLVAGGLMTGATVTVLLVWLTWAMFPESEAPTVAAESPAKPATPAPSDSKKLRDALLSVAVVFPAVTIFYTLQWTGGILVLVFIAILSMQPGVAGNIQAGKGLIMGNILGGVASILFYETLVMVPFFPFMILLTLFCGLVFGRQLFSGKKTGPLFGMAFSTILLIVASTTTSTDEAGSEVIARVVQMTVAVVYVVVAFGVLERLTQRKKA